MKRFLYIAAFVISAILLYFVVASNFPRQASRIPFFFALFIVDLYLWYSIRTDLKDLKSHWRYTLSLLYWSPLIILVLMVIAALVKPIISWPSALPIYVFGIAFIIYISKLVSVIFFLIADFLRIMRFTMKFVRSKKKGKPFKHESTLMSRSKFLKTLGLASGGLLMSGLLAGVIKWAYDFRVRRENIKIPGLPDSFNGLKIVQISDLHLGSWISTDPLDEAVNIINSLDPDLIFFTGDLVNSTSSEALKFRESLKRLQAKKGIFSILGNHDYGDYVSWPTEEEKVLNMRMLYKFYKSLGWDLLNNSNRIIEENGDRIVVCGVENWSKYERFPNYGRIKDAVSGTNGIPVKILLSHDPTHWEKVISEEYPDINLTLSGHTHGFQFGVELKGFRWSLAQYMYKYWAGLYSKKNGAQEQYLYVNRGLGMVGYPGRVGILPEITLITLEA